MVALSAWDHHRAPKARRLEEREDVLSVVFRMTLVVLFLLSILIELVCLDRASAITLAFSGTLTLFYYSVAIGSDPTKRGVGARIALDKLKQLLGPRWVPEPTPA